MNSSSSYYGRVFIIGRSNVGKSTLLNALIGEKISIISHKINTTNHNILGIYNNKNYQIEYIDTPGNIYDRKHIVQLLKQQLFDFILFILDRKHWSSIEDNIMNIINVTHIPTIIIINKIDLILNKNILLSHISILQKKISFIALFMVSAKNNLYTKHINLFICKQLPLKKHLYPATYLTNQTPELIIIDIIREKLLLYLHKEIPYLIDIKLNNVNYINNLPNFKTVEGMLFIKKKQHKKIIIGKNGKKIKLITYHTQKNICSFFKRKIILTLWVYNYNK
ncbi:GTPase Era [Enterobacteriaceae endosymbiont of Neohaemonia nigricornis]|uniref:GTPase Era n=1 Tax=Enterobacteriaceae endosymbiont of Neohaemonia nigricornis TaxID=2675792 RepID=UPI0014498D24|nr:GTPase Era [Enterobacteriaceae endosymbiont of Neohaemonia nigricornis]QJC30364.1 GTPase Era [Enterobacteriaceae endosymbiont of Neohaemonia nigricornis]